MPIYTRVSCGTHTRGKLLRPPSATPSSLKQLNIARLQLCLAHCPNQPGKDTSYQQSCGQGSPGMAGRGAAGRGLQARWGWETAAGRVSGHGGPGMRGGCRDTGGDPWWWSRHLSCSSGSRAPAGDMRSGPTRGAVLTPPPSLSLSGHTGSTGDEPTQLSSQDTACCLLLARVQTAMRNTGEDPAQGGRPQTAKHGTHIGDSGLERAEQQGRPPSSPKAVMCPAPWTARPSGGRGTTTAAFSAGAPGCGSRRPRAGAGPAPAPQPRRRTSPEKILKAQTRRTAFSTERGQKPTPAI